MVTTLDEFTQDSPATGTEPNADSNETPDIDTPDVFEANPSILDRFEYDGHVAGDIPVEENSPDPVSRVWVWESNTGPKALGVYKNDDYADEGYPWTVVRTHDRHDPDAKWRHTHIADSPERAVNAVRRKADHIIYLEDSKKAETYPEWVERTGGTAYDPPNPFEDDNQDDRISYRETDDGAYSWRVDLPDSGPDEHPNTKAAGVIAEKTALGEWTVTLTALDGDYNKLDEDFMDPGSRVLATYDSKEKAIANAEHTAERLADGDYGEFVEIDRVDDHVENAETDEQDADNADNEDDLPSARGMGGGRRRLLAAIEQKEHLGDLPQIDSLEDMEDAIRKLQLDPERYLTPPNDVIETVERVYEDLPEDAQREFLQDDTLHRRIRSARNQFNDWLGKLKRAREIPSPIEAGFTKYPSKKAKKTSRYEREAKDELDERIDKIAAGARGAKQRALEAIGSSLSEHNEDKAENQREVMRKTLSKGSLVKYRSPREQIGGVIRVNKKSVRVRRPNPRAGETKPMSDEPEPEYIEGRIQLDSEYLEEISPTELPSIDGLPDDLEAARNELFGAEWVTDHL